MNKNDRKKKGFSKRALALALCFFCLLATIPKSAFALETGEMQMPEESISGQQSENTGESQQLLSSETSGSQTDTKQSTSEESIESIVEEERETETETEKETETGSTSEPVTEIVTENGSDVGSDDPVCTCTPVNGVHADFCEMYEAPEVDTSAVDALFAKLMAFESYEALDAYMSEEMTEDEYVLMGSFTEAQNVALTERISELSEYNAEILDTVTVDQVLETFDHTANGNRYQTSRVYLAVRTDGNLPGEPSDQGSNSYYFYNSNYEREFGQFGSCPKGIINKDIVDYQNFIFTSVDGTDTAGLVDSTGVTTNQVLSGIDFDKLLDAIANASNRNPVTATDGQVVSNDNKDKYKVVCYVIKLQLDTNYGWHIDCAVVPKTYVTLSYDINIPDGYEIQTSGVGVPNSKTGLPPATFAVGAMSGLTTIDGEQNAIKVVNASDSGESYVFMFKGWNTKADGSGDWYDPTENITISENTVLYAIWDSNPAMGTGNLEIKKIVNAKEVSDDATFTFQVSIQNADGSASTDTYIYVIYNSNTIAQSRGKITSGGTISLKHMQYVEIQDLPAVNEEGGQPNVTVQEINHEGYDASWDGGNTVCDTTNVTIQGGRNSRVTCTNTVSAPKSYNLTITKTVSGNMYDANKGFAFTVVYGDKTVTFDLKKDGTYTIENIPVGADVTVTEAPDGYTYSFVSITDGVTATDEENGVSFTMPAQDVTVVINNDKTVTVDTGVSLESLPYVLILGVVIVGAVLLIMKRRNRYDD